MDSGVQKGGLKEPWSPPLVLSWGIEKMVKNQLKRRRESGKMGSSALYNLKITEVLYACFRAPIELPKKTNVKKKIGKKVRDFRPVAVFLFL